MDYVINKTEQIAITADSPREALQKIMAGEGTPIALNYGANPRPQTPVQHMGTLNPAQMAQLAMDQAKKS